jgi:sRNA-binding protein
MNVAQRRADAARADAVIEALARLWPRCFFVFEGRRKPLAVGIHEELCRQLEPMIRAGRINERDIAIALRRYAANSCYLYSCAHEGAVRIGLNGKPCGAVSAEQAARAQRLLDRRRRRRALAEQAREPQAIAAIHGLAEQDMGAVP